MISAARALLFVIASLLAAISALAQQFSPALYQDMRWRLIGPFRGGRTVAISGVPAEPNLFYIGATDGGVWKSNDYGQTWNPIFDGQPSASVGALAVAPSDPKIIYVGSGEGLRRPDLSTIGAKFGLQSSDPRYLSAADLNNDGITNIVDLVLTAGKFGQTC